MKDVVAYIPLRGGSKSIPLKNVRNFCGKPLAYWTVKAANDCSLIDVVYVATDSEQIANTIKNFTLPKICVISRSPYTATDTASTELAMIEFAHAHKFNEIILIQATNPLLTAKDLTEGILLYKNGHYDSLLSAVEQKRFIWHRDGDRYTPQNYEPHNRPRRQEMIGYYVENGAFYITSYKRLLETKTRLSGKIGIYPMDDKTYFEIDEPSDWTIIEEIAKQGGMMS